MSKWAKNNKLDAAKESQRLNMVAKARNKHLYIEKVCLNQQEIYFLVKLFFFFLWDLAPWMVIKLGDCG